MNANMTLYYLLNINILDELSGQLSVGDGFRHGRSTGLACNWAQHMVHQFLVKPHPRWSAVIPDKCVWNFLSKSYRTFKFDFKKPWALDSDVEKPSSVNVLRFLLNPWFPHGLWSLLPAAATLFSSDTHLHLAPLGWFLTRLRAFWASLSLGLYP